MADIIARCPRCGARNRVPAGMARTAAMCGKCHLPLFREPAEEPHVRADGPPGPGTRGAAHEGHRYRILAVLTIGGAILVFLWSGPETEGPTVPGAPPSPEAGPTVDPEAGAEALPAGRPPPAPGILVDLTGRMPRAPLTIVTSAGADYYVKLVDARTGADAVIIYVHGGQKLDVEVPVGKYIMRYASGTVWRGPEHLFGPGHLTSYNEATAVFDFKISDGYAHGYTVELIRQPDGNLGTRRIEPSEF